MHKLKCFICNEICLGLKGQDTVCDTVFALSEVEDKQMLEAQAFGECHLKCLINSIWGGYWGRRTLHNLVSVRSYPLIGEIDGISVLRNERIRTTFLVSNNGWVSEVHDQLIKKRFALKGGFFLPIKEDFYADLSDMPSVAHEIQTTFLNNATFSLHKLIESLGIENHLLNAESVRNGILHSRSIEHLSPTAIAAYAEYHEYLPERVVQLILTNIDTQRPPSVVGSEQ